MALTFEFLGIGEAFPDICVLSCLPPKFVLSASMICVDHISFIPVRGPTAGQATELTNQPN